MNRILFSISIIFILCSNNCTLKTASKEAATNDSIKKYLELAGDVALDSKIRLKYNDKAFEMIDLSKNDSLNRFYLYSVSCKYSSFIQNDKLKATAEKLLNLSLKSKDSVNIARAYRNLGLYYMNNAHNEEAMKFLCQSEYFFLKLKKLKYLSSVYVDKAFIYFYENSYFNCESSTSKALIYLDNNPNERIKNEIKPSIIISKMYLPDYYSVRNDAINSKKSALESLRLAELTNTKGAILALLTQLSLVDKVNAFDYLKEYIKIEDSLKVEERNSKDKYGRITHETDKITQEKESAIKQRWVVSITSIIIILLVLIILVITNQQSKEKEIQLLKRQQKANEEIYTLLLIQNDREDEARRSEKIRIARELHDGVMNRLSSTRLNLDILKYRNDEETIKKCLPHIEELHEIEQEIRNISHDLNIKAFTNSNGFVALLDNLTSKLNEISSTRYSIEISQDIFWNIISSNIKINIYRIIQESCSNINKFAKAQNATISLTLDENNLCLSITDDGQGFDTETKSAGIGLKNIEQRVEMLNGDFFIQSIKNKSTSINIAIPIL